MEDPAFIITNIFKAILVIGIIALVLAVVSFFTTYLFEITNFREEKGHFSTSVGNALLVLHSFFEPGGKPKTEQVIWIRKRKTPLEKKMTGLAEFEYDKIFIRGYKLLKNKKYKMKIKI
jgi:hypothetical protein